jgi:uncharacterized protein (UPF0332 family)
MPGIARENGSAYTIGSNSGGQNGDSCSDVRCTRSVAIWCISFRPEYTMPRARAQDVLLVAKSNQKTIALFRTGVSLEKRTGYEIDILVSKATVDRIELSERLRRAATAATKGTQRSFRSATSRAYYSMYHALRATAFFAHKGDDHEEHNKLPSGIPRDFPDRDNWENDLKNARYERNRADYDPYPKNDLMFKPIAIHLIQKADTLLPIVRSYLKKNGCNL